MVAPVKKTKCFNIMGPQPNLHKSLKVEDRLGHGFTSNVFRSDALTSRPLAVKLACPGRVSPNKIRQVFMNEANFSIKFDHPNIIKIYGCGEYYDPSFITEEGNPPLPFLASELLEGKPLDHYVKSSLQFPVLRALRVTRDIASALKAIHDKGYIHGDLKPGNVMFDHRTDHITLIDLSDPIKEGSVSKKEHLGTINYMAPERRCTQEYDKTIDIYALGLTLYELLTGEGALPHVHEINDPEKLKDHYFGFLARLDGSNLPLVVKELISRMTKILKEERFQNAQDLIDAVDRVIEKLEAPKAASTDAA